MTARPAALSLSAARALLGVTPDADERELRKAYREAAKRAHPDRPTGDAALFRDVLAAYRLLQDTPIVRTTFPPVVASAAPVSDRVFLEIDIATAVAGGSQDVDIDGRRSWLQNNGVMYYQSGLIGPGKPGQETPRGTFYVNRKVKDEISWEFGNAPMPYATYFTYNGIAFHQGDPNYLSNGCVRMYRGDAQRYFNDLQIGDKVYVF